MRDVRHDPTSNRHERQQSRDADFRKLVAQIADGKAPDPDFVDHVLTDNRKSLDDLRPAVELLLHRRQLRETWDKAATMANLRHWAESRRQEIRFVAHKSEEMELRKRADRRDAKAESLEPGVAKLLNQIEQLDEEESRIRNQMLEP